VAQAGLPALDDALCAMLDSYYSKSWFNIYDHDCFKELLDGVHDRY
jgi:hypothetical protein